MRVVDGVTELIGQTPMIRLSRLFGHLPAQLWGKLELMNPMSV